MVTRNILQERDALNDTPAMKVLLVDFAAHGEMVALLTNSFNQPMSVEYCKSDALSLRLLNSLMPDCVVFALLGHNMDAHQVIERLEAIRYTGAILVLGPVLLFPDMVKAELQKLGPGKRLTLTTPSPPQSE